MPNKGRHSRPPRKAKGEELVKYLLMRSLSKSEQRGGGCCGVDDNTEIISMPGQIGAGHTQNNYKTQTGGGVYRFDNEDNENVEQKTKATTGLLNELKSFRERLEAYPIQEYSPADQAEIVEAINEMDNITCKGKECCTNLIKWAREQILTKSHQIKADVFHKGYGFENNPRAVDIEHMRKFLVRYKNAKSICLDEFEKIYSEVAKNVQEIDVTMNKNEFRNNNNKLHEFVMGKGGYTRTSINQIIRSNMRNINQNEKQLGGLVGQFNSLQEKAQNKLAEASQMLGDGDNASIASRIDISGPMTAEMKQAKAEYIDAQRHLLSKQQSMLAAEREQLTELGKQLYNKNTI